MRTLLVALFVLLGGAVVGRGYFDVASYTDLVLGYVIGVVTFTLLSTRDKYDAPEDGDERKR